MEVGSDKICKTCDENYELKDKVCKLIVPDYIPTTIHGCLTFDGAKCTAPRPGYACDTAGLKCWTTYMPSSGCFKFSTAKPGECEVCATFGHVRKPDTNGLLQCQSASLLGISDYCDITNDGCKCASCKQGFTEANGSCTPTGFTTIPKCVKYASTNTDCQLCGYGSIPTTDKKCYDLTNISRHFTASTVSSIPVEPCITASDKVTCTACANFSDGIDAGLVTLTADESNTSKAESFCVYNTWTGKEL